MRVDDDAKGREEKRGGDGGALMISTILTYNSLRGRIAIIVKDKLRVISGI